MIKSKSQQKYLPKINQLTIDTQFKPVQKSKIRHSSMSVHSKIEEPLVLVKSNSIKSEILKIPKARQLLNMDKHIYIQDLEKRLQLLGDIKQQNYRVQVVSELQGLCKPVGKKKTKRHKTSFKVPLTRNNIEKMNNIIQQHIDNNRKLKNKQVILLPQYQKIAPFNVESLKFIDSLNEVNKKYKQKFTYEKDNLSKNRLLLEHVILNRNIKRQLKLDKDKQAKIHAKNLQFIV